MVWYYFVAMFCDGMDSMRNGLTIIQDVGEFGWNHFDLETQKQLNIITIFPIRIKKFFIINPPTIFNAVIKICKTFMSTKLLDRMETTTKVKDCLNLVSADQLWSGFGGNVDFNTAMWADHLLSWSYKNEGRMGIPLQ